MVFVVVDFVEIIQSDHVGIVAKHDWLLLIVSNERRHQQDQVLIVEFPHHDPDQYYE